MSQTNHSCTAPCMLAHLMVDSLVIVPLLAALLAVAAVRRILYNEDATTAFERAREPLTHDWGDGEQAVCSRCGIEKREVKSG